MLFWPIFSGGKQIGRNKWVNGSESRTSHTRTCWPSTRVYTRVLKLQRKTQGKHACIKRSAKSKYLPEVLLRGYFGQRGKGHQTGRLLWSAGSEASLVEVREYQALCPRGRSYRPTPGWLCEAQRLVTDQSSPVQPQSGSCGRSMSVRRSRFQPPGEGCLCLPKGPVLHLQDPVLVLCGEVGEVPVVRPQRGFGLLGSRGGQDSPSVITNRRRGPTCVNFNKKISIFPGPIRDSGFPHGGTFRVRGFGSKPFCGATKPPSGRRESLRGPLPIRRLCVPPFPVRSPHPSRSAGAQTPFGGCPSPDHGDPSPPSACRALEHPGLSQGDATPCVPASLRRRRRSGPYLRGSRSGASGKGADCVKKRGQKPYPCPSPIPAVWGLA